MARLPDVQSLGARPVPVSRRQIATVRNAGAVGEAVAGLGETAARIGEQRLAEEDRFTLASKQSDFVARKIAIDTAAENDQDYETLPQRYGDQIKALRNEIGGTIKSRRVRETFDINTRDDEARGLAAVQGLVVAKRKDAGRATLFETLKANREAALSAPDAADSNRLIEETKAALASARAAGYITAAQEAEQRDEFTQSYAQGRLSLFPDDKQVELLGKSLTSEKTNSFLDFIPIDKRKALMEAAQTRIRADERARRAEQRLLAQEAIDDAEEILRLANDGVPLPVERIETARQIAETNGKDALAYGLGVAATKTKITAEYQSSTPAEMQDDINALNARITKAGANASPADVVARDHLLQLRDKANQELSADPVSWAARAWGMDVPPIDWDDPATLGQRLKVARTVSGRTGVALSPLTDEEVSSLQADYDRGAVGQIAVIDRIKQFGPQGAIAAARQIAPNNDAFRVVAALATGPIKSVGRSTALDILTGPDALKANPEIFKADQANSWFSQNVAPAMRLLSPEMRAGLLEASRNIYATRLSRAGRSRWESGEWPGAISAALGAYRDATGTRRGGLGEWRGQTVLLPSDWSQDEFEKAVSRADATTLATAAGGAPVWSNGKPVAASSLKRMQLINVGDGIYQVFDGNGYLSSSSGGPFRIDIKRLPRR